MFLAAVSLYFLGMPTSHLINAFPARETCQCGHGHHCVASRVREVHLRDLTSSLHYRQHDRPLKNHFCLGFCFSPHSNEEGHEPIPLDLVLDELPQRELMPVNRRHGVRISSKVAENIAPRPRTGGTKNKVLGTI